MALEAQMRRWITNFLGEEDGQDIIEYSLLIIFVAIATMWVMGSGRPAVNQIWTNANTTISNAGVVAGGG
jgi:Flp pilus assembly pilin Flp